MTRLADRFMATAQQHSGDTALIMSGLNLSYGDLCAAAGEVAASLARMRLPHGVPVAIRVARTPASLLAILGTILAGNPYVPIDYRYPPGRVKFMLDDCSPAALIDGTGPAPVINEMNRASDVPQLHPDTLYVMYTSGSSGRPKGCMVTNQNVISLFDSTASIFSFGPADISSAVHSLGFDFSVWEVWSAWLHGGAIWGATGGQIEDPGEAVACLRQHGVTRLSATPSLFAHLVREICRREEPLPALRSVVLGGEPARITDAGRLLRSGLAENADIFNMYGITETTVHVTQKIIDIHAKATPDGSTPIGIPIPSMQVSLRADDGDEVRDGQTGEIWISGLGVCAGYLGRPDLTAARFHETESGQRWYRSGDLARREGGELYYVSRNDRQIQLRGFRVELGEVEAALEGLPEVDRAVACVEERGRSGHPVLVAYVQLRKRAASQVTADLRRAVRRTLPPQAVPQFIDIVDHFPLTANGKTDLHAMRLALSRA